MGKINYDTIELHTAQARDKRIEELAALIEREEESDYERGYNAGKAFHAVTIARLEATIEVYEEFSATIEALQ